MTTPQTHIDETWLLAYSSGSLPEGLTLAVATHIAMCDTCRATVRRFDALGGELLTSVQPKTDPKTSLAAIFDRADSIETTGAHTRPTPNSDLPAPLQCYVPNGFDGVKWRNVGRGAKQAILCDDGNSTARLLYIPSGMALPDHGHEGTEMTVVLQGAFWDGDQRFGAGDIECASPDVEHQPIADIGEDCICLAASDAPLRFKSVLPRLLQPIIRI